MVPDEVWEDLKIKMDFVEQVYKLYKVYHNITDIIPYPIFLVIDNTLGIIIKDAVDDPEYYAGYNSVFEPRFDLCVFDELCKAIG